MKYLKGIFESRDLTDDTKKVLKDLDITESEYDDMISFIGMLGFHEVRNALPFLAKWDNFNLGYEHMIKLIDFYNLKKIQIEKSEEIEDYFLDMMDDKNQSIEIKFNHTYRCVEISFNAKEMKDLSTLSKLILKIDDRFKRANREYKIVNIFNRINDETSVSYTILKLEY